MKDRYAARLGVALLGAVVLLLIVGTAVQGQTATQVRDDAKRNLETSAAIQSNEIAEWLGGNERQARTISQLPEMKAEDTAKTNQKLGSLVRNDHVAEEVFAIHVVSKKEKQIVASSKPGKFVGVKPPEMNAPFTSKIKSGFSGSDEVYVSQPFTIPIVDFPVVAILSPVPDKPRLTIIMINATGQTAQLQQPVEGGHTTVVTADGKAVASPDEGGQADSEGDGPGESGAGAQEGSEMDKAIQDALAGNTGVVSRDDGTLMGYAAVGSEEWVVLTHVPRDKALAMTETVRNGVLGMVLVAMLALGLVGATVGRSTANALRSLSSDARRLGDGDLDVEFSIDRSDELGTLALALADMRDSLRNQIQEAQEAREDAELRQQRTEKLNDHLETKATEYGEALSAVAAGNLTRRVDPDSESEAMGDVGRSINDTVASLSATLAEVKRFAGTVDEQSGAVDAGAEDVWRASEEASEAVQEISDGATSQHSMLDDVSSEMETLSATAEEAASATDDLATTSEAAAEAGKEGREAAQEAIEEMYEVESQTESAADRIENLDDEMAVIGEVTEVISGIAEQTNILALNASIEASRAGEAGEGFAVVADEVKSLAEETREAAEDIEERIEGIQDETDETVGDIQETLDRLESGVDTVEQAIGALEDIASHVDEADAGVKEISQATAEQARSAQSVASMVDDLTSISEQTTTEAQTVASASEEQTATLTEVSESASELSSQADDLEELLAAFDVDESVTADRDDASIPLQPAEDD